MQAQVEIYYSEQLGNILNTYIRRLKQFDIAIFHKN